MVHAQITCGRFRPVNHENDAADRYASRQRLDPRNGGDILTAMCTYGLCLENLPGKDQNAAALEIPLVPNVRRVIQHNCSVAYDAIREADMYMDAERTGELRAVVSQQGVISARFTGAGAHYKETVPDHHADGPERLRRAVREAKQHYCYPVTEDPGGAILEPFTLDHQDRLYILDQGHISVPLLEYAGQYCIDFSSGAVVKGIMVIDNQRGAPRNCVTRDLYSALDPGSVYNPPGLARGLLVAYTRCVKDSGDESVDEPLGSRAGTGASLQHLDHWLTEPLAQQIARFGGPNPALGLMASPLQGHDYDMDTGSNMVFGLEHADGEKSLLGGPLPVQIVPDAVGTMAKTVRVAPLMYRPGVDHQVSVQVDSGHIDTDELADRVSRSGARNIIGVAMQKIDCNSQGDIMLHDGV